MAVPPVPGDPRPLPAALVRPALSRRALLRGGLAVAGAGLLAGCSGDGGGNGPTTSLLVVSPTVPAASPQRLVFVLRGADNEFVRPRNATVRLGREMGQPTGARLPVTVHTDAAPAPPYLTLTATLPEGVTWVHLESEDGASAAPVEATASPPGVQAGMAMPAIPTPTAGDLLGLEVLCTHIPPCSLHDVTVADALDTKRPTAILVATPAYCQTAACGPVLDILLRALPDMRRDLQALHLEVYAKRPSGPEISRTPLSPSVKALGLESEPVLFLVGRDGIVQRRLDGIIGTAELRAAVDALT